MSSLKFKYPDEACVYPKLIAAVNALCETKGKDALCTSGYRSLEKQKITNKLAASISGRTQRSDGSVYDKLGKCWAAAYGESNHNYCIAMDMDGWIENINNTELKKYGLIKPMAHEPWHIQLIEHTGIGKTQKEIIRDACIKGVSRDMNAKDFQVLAGLQADGIVGPKTKEKLKEMLQFCQGELGLNFNTPEEVIKVCTNEPDTWLGRLKTIPYFPAFIMSIVNKMGGK